MVEAGDDGDAGDVGHGDDGGDDSMGVCKESGRAGPSKPSAAAPCG